MILGRIPDQYIRPLRSPTAYFASCFSIGSESSLSITSCLETVAIHPAKTFANYAQQFLGFQSIERELLRSDHHGPPRV